MDMSAVTRWLSDFTSEYKPSDSISVVIAPSFVHIPYVFLEVGDTPATFIGGQDTSLEQKGSHTGEVSASQLKDYCKYCIVGHSERKENPSVVAQKIDRLSDVGLIPIVCFISPEQASGYYKKGVILVWEDPANISKDGVYNEKPVEIIEKQITKIRKSLPEEAVLLYGGSVNKTNIASLSSMGGLSGVLAGHASLDPAHFLELIKSYEIH